MVPGYLFPLYKKVFRLYDRLVSGKAIVHPNSPPLVKKKPYVILAENGRRLVELPLNVMPLVPYPFISYVFTSEGKFRFMYNLIREKTPLIVHALHDFEFMDCGNPEEYTQSQAVDTVARQDLASRLAMQRTILTTLAKERQIVTAGEYVRDFLARDGSGGEKVSCLTVSLLPTRGEYTFMAESWEKEAVAFDQIYSGGGLAGRIPLLGPFIQKGIIERHNRALAFLSATRAQTILDLGCGVGRFAVAAAQRGVTVHAYDISQPAIAVAQEAARSGRGQRPLSFLCRRSSGRGFSCG